MAQGIIITATFSFILPIVNEALKHAFPDKKLILYHASGYFKQKGQGKDIAHIIVFDKLVLLNKQNNMMALENQCSHIEIEHKQEKGYMVPKNFFSPKVTFVCHRTEKSKTVVFDNKNEFLRVE